MHRNNTSTNYAYRLMKDMSNGIFISITGAHYKEKSGGQLRRLDPKPLSKKAKKRLKEQES